MINNEAFLFAFSIDFETLRHHGIARLSCVRDIFDFQILGSRSSTTESFKERIMINLNRKDRVNDALLRRA